MGLVGGGGVGHWLGLGLDDHRGRARLGCTEVADARPTAVAARQQLCAAGVGGSTFVAAAAVTIARAALHAEPPLKARFDAVTLRQTDLALTARQRVGIGA